MVAELRRLQSALSLTTIQLDEEHAETLRALSKIGQPVRDIAKEENCRPFLERFRFLFARAEVS